MTASEPVPAAPALPRRRLLGVAGAGAGSAVLLSACGSRDGTGTAEPVAPSTPVDAGAVEDIPVGSAVKVDQEGVQAVVGRPDRDTVAAFSPVCPHQGCMVAPREKLYVCPCHSSEFDLATGEVLAGPAESGLTPYPVMVQDGRIVLG